MPLSTKMLLKALNACGLDRYKPALTIEDLRKASPRASSGMIVEFVGTQGVGKTTLNSAVRRSIKDRWFYVSDMKFTGPTASRSDVIEALHREIYFRRMKKVKKNNPDPWRSLSAARQSSKTICESLMISSNTLPRGFFLDEGLFKTFPREVMACDLTQAQPLWANRALIHISARKAETTLERFQSRWRKRQKRGALQHKQPDDEILARIRSDRDVFDKMCQTAEMLGRPTTTVYIEDGLEANVNQVLEFEKSLLAV